MKVAPAELEALLIKHPEVTDAAVVGLPDEEAGELPVAFVVPRHKSKVTQTELETYVAGNNIVSEFLTLVEKLFCRKCVTSKMASRWCLLR